MNDKKEKAPLNKVEEAKLNNATFNEIMFHMLNAVIPAMQLARTELQKMGAALEETKAELKKAKEQNSNPKLE